MIVPPYWPMQLVELGLQPQKDLWPLPPIYQNGLWIIRGLCHVPKLKIAAKSPPGRAYIFCEGALWLMVPYGVN